MRKTTFPTKSRLHGFPGVVNRTFDNRTQSNSNRSIDFDWVRKSNLIELTLKFCQSNTIERSETEHLNNRT